MPVLWAPLRGTAEASGSQALARGAEATSPTLSSTVANDSMQAAPPRLVEGDSPSAASTAGRDRRPGSEAQIWLPATAVPSKPRVLTDVGDCEHGEEEHEGRHQAMLRQGIQAWKLRMPTGTTLRSACSFARACVPARIKALTASASRDTSMAARVHTGATVAVVIPPGVTLPSEAELTRHSLRHPANVRGWAELTDGSALGLLQIVMTDEGPRAGGRADGDKRYTASGPVLPEAGIGWANHGQAKALYRAQIQIVKLLGHRVDVSKQAELRNAPRSDCHEVLSRTLPGARMWPLHDPLVSRVFLLNISRERCRNCSSFLRLDRGPRFLDLARLHYGEEVAFLFAWHSHYIYCLAAFVAVTVPLIIARTVQGKGHIDHSMLPHSMLTILFGVCLSEFWRPRAKRLVHRWHAHGDTTSRWHHLVLDLLESHAAKAMLTEDEQSGSGNGQEVVAIEDLPVEETSIDVEGFAESKPAASRHAAEFFAVGGPRTNGTPDTELGGALQDSSGDWSQITSEDASGMLPRLPFCEHEVPIPESDEPFCPNQAMRQMRYSRTRAMSSLEAAAMDECMDTFGITGDSTASISSNKRKCRWLRSEAFRKDIKRLLKTSLIVPILVFEWVSILVFFSGIVWFEIWVIFDWGGCRAYNEKFDEREWKCVSADYLRGPIGVVMGALPSIAEGAFFELLLVTSKVTARVLIRLYHFRTREQHDFAVVTIIFMLEVVGKVGFILVLGLGFVPVWSSDNWQRCRHNWDYFIMGEWSLGCLKGQIPFEVRLKLFESIMKGPMWVSGMVGIGIKTLAPLLLGLWRRTLMGPTTYEDSCACSCRRHRVVRVLLAPADFVLRVCMLILQADCGAVGGLKLICRWPPALAKERASAEEAPHQEAERLDGFGSTGVGVRPSIPMSPSRKMRARRRRLCNVLLEGERREHEPFDEYIELLLHFLWTSCFAIVWPLGCIFSLLNMILEFRFDCIKLLAVRRRRFPSSRHMSVAWVPRFARAVCHISIVVNVMLLLMPYRQLLIWSPGSCSATKDAYVSFLTACKSWQIIGAFLGTWACFVVFYYLAKWTLVRLIRRRFSRCCGAQPHAVRECKEKPTHLSSASGQTSPGSPASRRSPSAGSPSGRRRVRTKLPDASPDSVDSLGMRTQAMPAKLLSY